MTDQDAIEELTKRWYDYRERFSRIVADAVEVNGARLPQEWENEGWVYRFHGFGVDVSNEQGVDGIDFDFDKPAPDVWRLRFFLIKQYNAGNLTKRFFRPLMQNKERFNLAFQNWQESTWHQPGSGRCLAAQKEDDS